MGGEITLTHCFIAYVQVGVGGGTHRLFNVLAAGSGKPYKVLQQIIKILKKNK